MSIVSHITTAEAPITVRQFFVEGDPGPLISTFAHVPELLNVAMPFLAIILGPSSINIRTKEIVILRVSVLQECSYCIATHSVIARKANLSKEEVIALRNRDNDIFPTATENVLLQWIDVIARGPLAISSALREKMKEHFEESEIVELTLLIGATVMLNRYSTALELPVSTAHQEFLAQEGLNA